MENIHIFPWKPNCRNFGEYAVKQYFAKLGALLKYIFNMSCIIPFIFKAVNMYILNKSIFEYFDEQLCMLKCMKLMEKVIEL